MDAYGVCDCGVESYASQLCIDGNHGGYRGRGVSTANQTLKQKTLDFDTRETCCEGEHWVGAESYAVAIVGGQSATRRGREVNENYVECRVTTPMVGAI